MELFFLNQDEYDEISADLKDAKIRKARFKCGTPCIVARNGKDFFIVKVNLDAGFKGTEDVWRNMTLISHGEDVEVRYIELTGVKAAQFLSGKKDKIEYYENDGILQFVPFDPELYMKVNELIDEFTVGEFFDYLAEEIARDYVECDIE